MNVLHLTPKDNLQEILSKIRKNTVIYLSEGEYYGKFTVDADDVRIIGNGRETTVLTFDDYARKPHEDGGEYNTFRTFTLCVTGERVVLENLTVANSNTAPEVVGQCVALSVNAHVFAAKNVKIVSGQDTLFTAPFPDDLVVRYSGLTDDKAYYDGFIPRKQLYIEGESFHLFEGCEICGTVDFIFGGARALFEGCRLVSLKDKRGKGYVAAPCHPLAQRLGYLFYKCEFVGGGAEKGSVFLARPWRDFGKCNFIDCRLGGHISPLLYDKWNDTYRDRTARFEHFNLQTAADCPPLAPVSWGKELDPETASEIINAFTALKKSTFGEL